MKESNDRNGMLMAQLVQFQREKDQQKSMRIVSEQHENALITQTDATILKVT